MKNYLKHKSWRNWLKATLALSLSMAIGGLAYAVLSSPPASLTNNTIQTASANLLLSTDGTNYNTAFPGFDFSNLIPGGVAMPASGHTFYLKNTGGVPLAVKLRMTKQPNNPDNIALDKVNIVITPSGGPVQTFSLRSLLDAGNSGLVVGASNIGTGISQQYKLQVSMAADALSGSSASLSGIDLVFNGTAGS